MLAATPAKKYANPEFLLHAVLILWGLAVDVGYRFWCAEVSNGLN